ncbi:unnamed protein product [Soboliphyme baturini]|uniref:Ras-associating domain-containing protein n=1 Tax=Soboliphyme baturini TaxID=241478 RepID=A0A183I9K5_9BILA|nr:unnamed protein product [Soboliphyme baturini]
MESAIHLALEVSAEEVNETHDENGTSVFEFLCKPNDMKKLAAELREKRCSVVGEDCEFRSTSKVKLSDSQNEIITIFYKVLGNSELFSRAFDNIASD